ncbi:PRD domain-containing protein [Cryobacterium arcticum]|uniref:Transcriptional antiterminator n=1 Tax=Cryobacterium arcticum TaxID=670052 RepID=A0A317ZPU1_9MICO|nr:PRD domain-containing protein [Cryobacterium arcticum]PXA67139.1 transcriptional antiterminator [Cryobacterium arcticum]
MARAPKSDAPGTQRILNNNVVIVVDDGGNERVLMGAGLGFRLKTDSVLDLELVEKSFVLESKSDGDRARTLLVDMPYEAVEAVMSAIEVAERQLKKDLGRRLPLAVLDHMNYVIERVRTGLQMAVAPMPELAILYPDEFAAATSMVESIGASLGVKLPPEECVFLTMHLLNTTRNQPDGTAAILLRRLQHIVVTVENGLGMTLDAGSADYARFILHIQFLLQRLTSGSMLRGSDSSFYQFAKHSYPRSFAVALAVQEYIAAATNQALTDEEVLYVTVHVERLTSRGVGPSAA